MAIFVLHQRHSFFCTVYVEFYNITTICRSNLTNTWHIEKRDIPYLSYLFNELTHWRYLRMSVIAMQRFKQGSVWEIELL